MTPPDNDLQEEPPRKRVASTLPLASRVVRPFHLELARAFAYPLGPAKLLVAGLVVLASGFVGFVPVVGWFLSGGIVLGYLAAVVRLTAAGKDDLDVAPEDIGGVVRWVRPLVLYTVTALVAFGPALASAYALGMPQGEWVVYPLQIAGAVYLPAALVVSAHAVRLTAPFNPLPALALIVRIPAAYAVLLLFLAAAFATMLGLQRLTDVLGDALSAIPILPGFLAAVLQLLPQIVAARMLGLLVREHDEELL